MGTRRRETHIPTLWRPSPSPGGRSPVLGTFSAWLQPNRAAWIAPAAVIFSPYVLGPVRFEHVVIYGLLVWSLLNINVSVRFEPGPRVIVGLMVLPMASAALASIVVWSPTLRSPPLAVFAAADNWLLPAATVALAALWLTHNGRATLLLSVCAASVGALSVNVLMSTWQRTANSDLSGFLAYFWAADARSGGWSVGEFAAEAGRFSGVFNQPAEAGIAYGLGLFMCLYLIWTRPQLWIAWSASAGLMILGGFLAASKIAMNVALPIFLVSLLLLIPWKPRLLASVALVGAVMAIGGSVASLTLDTMVSRYQYAATGDLVVATGGRWGNGAFGGTVIDDLLTRSPVIGLGLESYGTASDAEVIRLLGQSGLVGLGCFALVALILVVRWFTNSTGLATAERWLAGSTLLLVLAASLGLPALSANRAGTLSCLVLGLTLAAGVRAASGPKFTPIRTRWAIR